MAIYFVVRPQREIQGRSQQDPESGDCQSVQRAWSDGGVGKRIQESYRQLY
jgi:hypothetical protein